MAVAKGLPEIKKVAVIGAGVMGAGIAAHAANAGLEVLLFDRVADGKDPTAYAKDAIAKLLKTKPAPLMHAKFAKRITPANTRDDLALLKDADWVVEVVVENIAIKRDLYRTIAPHLKATALLSSNTSTLPLKDLMADVPAKLRERFVITHFFNPPRYLPLLEIVKSSQTDAAQVKRIAAFASAGLGKKVVFCKDTPGFIANRLGTYWLHASVMAALKLNITPEMADAVLGKKFGIPKTGAFALLDLVGLDIIPHVLGSLQGNLPKRDSFHALGPIPPLLHQMVSQGLTGRKAKQGFYKRDENNKKLTLDLDTCSYRPFKKVDKATQKLLKKDLRKILSDPSPAGRYAFEVMGGTIRYALECVPEISDHIDDVDTAMKLGYNWKYGPFELVDKIGAQWLADAFAKHGWAVPPLLTALIGEKAYRAKDGEKLVFSPKTHSHVAMKPATLMLADIKRKTKPLLHNKSASLWDAGDGVAVFEFHSKFNTFNPLVLRLLNKSLDLIEHRKMKGLVIYNESQHFSGGANLLMLYLTATLRLFPAIRWILRDGQFTFARMQEATFPIVGAPSGMALGGGCEVLLHTHKVVAHAETYMGLVEAGVGIVPGWGGCKQLLVRAASDPSKPKGPMPAVSHAFETIATAKVSTSAEEARDLLFLLPRDRIVMSRDHVLQEAKAEVLAMAKTHKPAELPMLTLPGASGAAALDLALHDFVLKGMATKHDVVVATELAKVLTGGKTDVTEQIPAEAILKLERDTLVKLAGTAGTRARIGHLLKTGKPLRN
jgi:3-hydroxyacyl-CoA dehydrogenase